MPSGSRRRAASRVRCSDNATSAAPRSRETALAGTGSRLQTGSIAGSVASQRDTRGQTSSCSTNAAPIMTCTTAIACIQRARALEPSTLFLGNKSGATLGNNHIARPNKRKPHALPVFIRVRHSERRACHAILTVVNYAAVACMRFVPSNYTGNFPTFRTRLSAAFVQNEAKQNPAFCPLKTRELVPKTSRCSQSALRNR
jgi:hypothetical protein